MSLEQMSLSARNLESVMQAFEHEGASVRAAMRYLLQEKEVIAASLLLCLSFLQGKHIEDVLIGELKKVEPEQFNQGLIDFQLSCAINNTPIDIGVAVLQETEVDEVCKALNRLFSYKDFSLNRLCILRSDILIDHDPQVEDYFSRLLSLEMGGSLVDLQINALEIILTILFVFRGRQKYAINVTDLAHYLETENILINNAILRNLLMANQVY